MKWILFLLISCQATLGALTTTINYTAGIGERSVHTFAGVPVPDGTPVFIGYFLPGFDPYSHENESLRVNFRTLGATTTRTIFGQTGKFADTAYANLDGLDDVQLWLYIDAEDSFGMFSGQQVDGWTYPSGDSPLFRTTSVNSSTVDQALWGTIHSDGLRVAPVPEPTTWALILFGLIMLAFKFRHS